MASVCKAKGPCDCLCVQAQKQFVEVDVAQYSQYDFLMTQKQTKGFTNHIMYCVRSTLIKGGCSLFFF